MRAASAALAGSIASGLLASACCLGPLVLTLLGISGAAVAHRCEPLRPWLLVSAYGLLAAAFYLVYWPRREECPPGDACARPGVGLAALVVLWMGAALVVLLTGFPWYSRFLF